MRSCAPANVTSQSKSKLCFQAQNASLSSSSLLQETVKNALTRKELRAMQRLKSSKRKVWLSWSKSKNQRHSCMSLDKREQICKSRSRMKRKNMEMFFKNSIRICEIWTGSSGPKSNARKTSSTECVQGLKSAVINKKKPKKKQRSCKKILRTSAISLGEWKKSLKNNSKNKSERRKLAELCIRHTSVS